MAIRVGHSTNAGAVAGAAFAGAAGQAQAANRVALGAQALHAAQIDQGALEAEQERAFRAKQQQTAFDLGQQGDVAGQARQQENMRLASSLQLEQSKAAHVFGQEDAVAAQGRGQQDLVFGLTTRQKMDLDQLADAEHKALNDPSFTPQEKEELKFRFAEKRAGIQPSARPKPKTPAELYAERTHTDPHTGRVYALGDDGSVKSIHEPPEKRATVQDRVAALKEAYAASMNADGKSDETKMRTIYKMILEGTGFQDAPAVPQTAGLQGSASPVGPESMFSSGKAAVTNFLADKLGAGAATPPDVTTPQGIGQRLGELRSNKVEYGAVGPDDMANLATADWHLRVERERLRRLEAAPPREYKGLDLTDPKVTSQLSSAALMEQQGMRTAHTLALAGDKRAISDANARIGEIQQRRGTLLAEHDELAGRQKAMAAAVRSGQVATPAPAAPVAPAIAPAPEGPDFGTVALKGGGRVIPGQALALQGQAGNASDTIKLKGGSRPAPAKAAVNGPKVFKLSVKGNEIDEKTIEEFANLRGVTIEKARAMLGVKSK